MPIRKTIAFLIALCILIISGNQLTVYASNTADDYIDNVEVDPSHPKSFLIGQSTDYRCLNQFCDTQAVNETLVTSAPYNNPNGTNPTQMWYPATISAGDYEVSGLVPYSNQLLSINCRRILGSYVNVIYMMHPTYIANPTSSNLSLNNNVGDADVNYSFSHYISAAGRLGWATRYIYETSTSTGYGGYYLGWSTSQYTWWSYDPSYNVFE